MQIHAILERNSGCVSSDLTPSCLCFVGQGGIFGQMERLESQVSVLSYRRGYLISFLRLSLTITLACDEGHIEITMYGGHSSVT